MPTYDYNCSDCGRLPDLHRGYDAYIIDCPYCVVNTATRIPVYRSQGVIFKGAGFTKSTFPPPPQTKADHQEVNELLGKEMAERNYPTDRVYDDLRKNRAENADGHIGIDYSQMPKKI